MTQHTVGTRDEWRAARRELLEREKEHTCRGDELARARQELPWVRVGKEYRFETDEGERTLVDLFDGRSQLLVYHLMFGPSYEAACPNCTAIADGFSRFAPHLASRDVALWAISRAPLPKLGAYKERLGWTFPWASSFGSDFNYDYDASYTPEDYRDGYEYNFRAYPGGAELPPGVAAVAATCGTTTEQFVEEAPGMSAFVLDEGAVFHTYSSYARGLDGLWGLYQWLDRTPLGREAHDDTPWRRRDEY